MGRRRLVTTIKIELPAGQATPAPPVGRRGQNGFSLPRTEFPHLPGSLILCDPANPRRGVARIGRAPVSKTGGWGFESLRPCQYLFVDTIRKN